MSKVSVVLVMGGEQRVLDCPMSIVQIIAEIIADNWEDGNEMITITIS